ncbi:methyltransferase domain-containing protein [Flammeovirga sp. MY04]|uniref:class I SAM-dependent methyltransferase n=1 Tax=Flammeovirga sp. MY04 TaxID=1191459 RepID=UPI0008061E4E|nr:methyltransferase domain-containing protein [Flammeovirga sp. MY04]ANQ47681.1 methyltransferase domain-containing protein [Flammeovirga sp. MY04]
MAFDFHKDKEVYFNIQTDNANKYVLPFIEQSLKITPNLRVLEVGCGEGGVLKAFLEKGCFGVGVELSMPRVELASVFLKDFIDKGQAQIIGKNVYDIDVEKDFGEKFDLIVLKDVIEHIPDQEKIIHYFRSFLKEHGKIFFGFPPWQMPFGGHQQIVESKLLSKLPYYHLLPSFLYKFILDNGNVSKGLVKELMDIKATGISLERFERICKRQQFKVKEKTHYFINPIYEYKFGLKPRKKIPILGDIPWVRNFVTTCGFYLVEKY